LNSASTSQVRQNFHAECEASVNHLVNLECYASYVYLCPTTLSRMMWP
uniref:Ferritin n=1 Tax=Gopherus agassizii TaxID=38772 RepID=A0A452J6W5_9SAUR